MRLARLAILLAVSGCADDLPSRSAIERLRVLAIRAEAPEIAFDEATAISILPAAPPADAPIVVEVGWRACVDPPGGDPLRCLDQPGVFGLPPGVESVLDLGRVAAVPSTATIGVVALACVGALDDVDRERTPLCVGEQEIAVRRVAVSDDPQNHNPAIESISVGGVVVPPESDGISIDGCEDPCPRYAVAVDATDDSAETIAGTGRRESTWVAWATDAGTLEPAFDDAPPFESFFTPPAGAATTSLYVVLHDDRGGVEWRTFLVETR